MSDTTDDGTHSDAGGEVLYDCGAWAVETRAMLANLVSSAGVRHAWQGPTLEVAAADEDTVDALVDEVLAASRPALDPSAPKLIYEVGQWSVALQSELAEALTQADVVYEWNHEGDLVVLAEDEDLVAEVLDEIPDPDDGTVASDDGVAVHEVLDTVFLSADRLARHPTDAAATVRLVEVGDLLERMGLPFGFEPPQWRTIVEAVGELSDRIAPDPGSTDAEISEAAVRVRELVREVV